MFNANNDYRKNRSQELVKPYQATKPANQMPASVQRLQEVLGYYQHHLKKSKKV